MAGKLSGCVFFLFVLFFGFTDGTVADETAPPGSQNTVIVIPVSGEVEPSMAAFIARAISDTAGLPDPLYVLEMDTFGGRVDSALQIVDELVNIKHGRTIAYVKTKAISAGALIALACNQLVMKQNTTIGDCAPIIYDNEGPKMMGEKFQSPLRAKFRTLARRNGYPETLAEAMVTADMVVYRVKFPDKTVYLDEHDYAELPDRDKKRIVAKETVVAKGELLTMDDSEALDLGFSKMSAPSIEDMLARMEVKSYVIKRIEPSWSEDMSRIIGAMSPILLMIGLAALYMELKAPGFGLPGIVGITCLALVFLNQYLVGLADQTELLLILLGFVLLGVEIFVTPGFGVMGFSGLAAIAIGMILSFQDFVIPDPSMPWQKDILTSNMIKVLGSYLLAFCISMLFLKYVFPRLGRVIEGPYLHATLEKSKADSEEAKRVTVGDQGTVVTALRPSGKADIGGEIIDVIAEGEFIDQGTPVMITDIRGNRVIVTRSEA